MSESRRATSLVEVRFESAPEDLSVLDAYCQATGKSRKDVMVSLLGEWSERKRHEATVIMRVTRGNPGE